MIIFKDGTWQIDGSYPDFDYTRYEKVYNNDLADYELKEREDYVETDNPVIYVISDDSPLTYKVMQYAPNMKIVTDENGIIIDIIEDYPIEEIIKNKQQEINIFCNNVIYGGIDYNSEHYDLTDKDQINMLAWIPVAQLGNSVPYHSSGNPCRIYSPEEFLGLTSAATQFKTYNLTYCNLLKQQISEMTNIDEIKNIKYGDNLNDKYQDMLNQLLGGQNETNS